MKIFFVGCVSFSVSTLNKVLALGGNVIGVATKSSSSFNADHKDLAPICQQNSIPFKYVKDINAPHIVNWIESFQPDIIFVFGWSSLIKKNLLQLPPMGVLGFHPSKLPANRGRHPIIWALVLGLNTTGSTFFFMDEGADSGDILSQSEIEIEIKDDANTLYYKIINEATLQIEHFLPLLTKGNYNKTSQENKEYNSWRKRGRLDGQIDFRMTSIGIYNLVRALTKPYVGAHIVHNNTDVKIWEVQLSDCDTSNLEPGKVLRVDNQQIHVKTYDGAIILVKHDFITLPKINEYL